MTQSRTSKTLLELHEHEPLAGPTEYSPPMKLSDMFAQEHVPPYAEYIRTNFAPFNVLSYLHRFGQIMVESLLAGYSHRHIYDFLKRQPRPVPVSYRQFTRGLGLFRQQKGLPPARVRRTSPPFPAAAGNAHNAPPAPLPAAAPRPAPAPSSAILTATPHAPVAPASVAAIPPVPAAGSTTSSDEVLSAAEVATREIEARLAKRFRPFTAEDAKHGKPIMEAIADKERADLEAYEQALRDGTAKDW